MVDRLPEQTSDFLLPFSNLSLQSEPSTVMDDPSSTANPAHIPIDPALQNPAFAPSFPVDDQSASGPSSQNPDTSESSAMDRGRSGHRQPSNTANDQFFCGWVYEDGERCLAGFSGTPGFPRECDLTKHYRNHTKPVFCLVACCSCRFAENKDMYRHMRTKHPTEAKEQGISGNQVYCSEVGCLYKTNRPDNLKRHREKMHPGVLDES
ncbi:hypothetical protein QBC34DRAFT_148794 [Podospora aff. communis PSN243]|uniref:C2H2-type domain-containing protein n=1 Tax=Podospora aff. communis PSN243 TaxID=3040156 RepID=A0AAV9GEM7_9PEZI|nr:hypothetical protein QBC34DRAFT_148794 [Podospora aff. communis PSN243]